jgi:hypothetical protein
MIRIRRSTFVAVMIMTCVVVLVKCTDEPGPSTPTETTETPRDRFSEFAGSASCANCHKTIHESHINTQHFLTSAPVTEKNILGSFVRVKNSFVFDKQNVVSMEKRNDSFYQVHYINGTERRKGRFDIVIGSGKKGQSYLEWIGSRLVQLPITYYTAAHQWSNSPGYPASKVIYNRVITSRCLECHSTFFQKITETDQQAEEFNRSRVIYAVDCEKCHGPSAKHVQFQTDNPTVKEANFVVNPSKLSRQQNLDLCTLCHGGQLNKTKPSFEFNVGDTLANYFSFNSLAFEAANIDVHGNQFGLLAMSKCFTQSEMKCTSCHNVHEKENGKLTTFSARCMNCHNTEKGHTCKMTNEIGPAITQNCIDCHMPKQESHTVAVHLQGSDKPESALMRTHYIKVYNEETNKVLAILKKMKPTSAKLN